MKKSLFISLFFSLAYTQEKAEFIDDLEYGKRLYENPRGISCQKCHGYKGEGSQIATYRHKGQKKILQAPNIKDLSLEAFLAKFKNSKTKNKDVMPFYYLTDQELNAIFRYLKNQPSF
ncbi:c-type cytochrome [Helicobacter pylori]